MEISPFLCVIVNGMLTLAAPLAAIPGHTSSKGTFPFALKRLEMQLAWPFEVRAAQEYALAAGITGSPSMEESFPVGTCRAINRELLSFENLRKLLLTEKGDFKKKLLWNIAAPIWL